MWIAIKRFRWREAMFRGAAWQCHRIVASLLLDSIVSRRVNHCAVDVGKQSNLQIYWHLAFVFPQSVRHESSRKFRMKFAQICTAALAGATLCPPAFANSIVAATAPIEATITGGPWTLAQGPASNAVPYNGYCVNGVQTVNPGKNLMQPYYFPHIEGAGRYLQGYFDYRPRNANEAVAAAWSGDAGRSWHFQKLAAQLSTACPTDPTNPDNPTSLGGIFDNGQGHPFVLSIGEHTLLYTLDRSDGNIDVTGLIVHEIKPTPNRPLRGVPDNQPVPDKTLLKTTGLENPDAILGSVRRHGVTTVMYVSKIPGGDTILPASQQCQATPAGAITAGRKANHDLITLRVATTTDGIHFTDQGAATGLNDNTAVDFHAIRYLGNGSLFPLEDGRYGMVFGAGNCLDGDSDGFHFIGYGVTTAAGDLLHWQVLNGIDNPILSTGQVTVASNTPGSAGIPTTIPATPPLGGYAPWYNGRVYGPTAAYLDENHLTVVFAGYSTPQPSLNLGDYRSIGVTTITLPSEADRF